MDGEGEKIRQYSLLAFTGSAAFGRSALAISRKKSKTLFTFYLNLTVKVTTPFYPRLLVRLLLVETADLLDGQKSGRHAKPKSCGEQEYKKFYFEKLDGIAPWAKTNLRCLG